MTVIGTRRLILISGQCSVADIKKQQDWLNDKELMQYSEQRHRFHDFYSQCDYIDSFEPPDIFLRITTGDQMIGTITAHVDKHNLVADMGILIGDKSKHGQGYGTEAWVALMEHLFGTGTRKIEAGCMQRNRGMVRIFSKAGMHLEGYREGHFIFEDNPQKYDVYDSANLEQWAKFNDGVH